MRDLSMSEIEEAVKDFKDTLQREANRFVRRHATAEALAALEAMEYIDKFMYDLKLRAGSQLKEYFSHPRRARPINTTVITKALRSK